MRSFRLYVGERKYLTAAGWASLAVAIAATLVIGYFGAAPLNDWVGTDSMWVVAGCGIGVWLVAQALLRRAGYPLIAEVPEADRAQNPWRKGGRSDSAGSQ
jgi:hypothetical protein